MALTDQPTAAPTRKVAAGAVGAAAATLVLFGLQLAGIEVPMGLEGAVTTLVTAAAMYLTRERAT